MESVYLLSMHSQWHWEDEGGAELAVRGLRLSDTWREGTWFKSQAVHPLKHTTFDRRQALSKLCQNKNILYSKDAAWHVLWVVSLLFFFLFFLLWQSSENLKVSVPSANPFTPNFSNFSSGLCVSSGWFRIASSHITGSVNPASLHANFSQHLSASLCQSL